MKGTPMSHPLKCFESMLCHEQLHQNLQGVTDNNKKRGIQ